MNGKKIYLDIFYLKRLHSKRFLLFSSILFLTQGVLTNLQGQTPSDGLMMETKQACILLGYECNGFDQYWEGDRLRENRTVATVQRHTVLPMIALGVHPKINFYLGLPYVHTRSSEPNGGKLAGVQGLQDLGLGVKYELLNLSKTASSLKVFGSFQFSTPLGNYLPDYMPYSLGLGAPELAYRAVFQYQIRNLYVRGTGGYLWRGFAQAERDYYYNEGSYYTSWMDVPHAWQFQGVLGYWVIKDKMRLEVNYQGIKSTDGDDIRPYNRPQPTNKMEMDQYGVFAQYIPRASKGLGILVYHQRVFNGRNVGKSEITGAGITYLFNWLKQNKPVQTP